MRPNTGPCNEPPAAADLPLRRVVALVLFSLALPPAIVSAQTPQRPQALSARDVREPHSEHAQRKESVLIREVLEPELVLNLDPTRSKIVRTHHPITQISITNPAIVEVNEFNSHEIELIGLRSGETTATIWFDSPDGRTSVLRYLVRVSAQNAARREAQLEYASLQDQINEMFPDSQVQLIPLGDKLVVRGQARDAEEAANILAIVGRRYGSRNGDRGRGGLGRVRTNAGTQDAIPNADDVSIINLLHVPGEQQVMLKVRVAELTRTSARDLGVDFSIMKDNFELAYGSIGGAANIAAILDAGDIELFIKAFSSHGYGKILAEPTLVTLSGQTATFIAGGEFAVPTAVGIDGIGAASTSFRGFGTELAFTPTVLDKDRIRISVAPSFSTLNEAATVDGIPGLNIRSATTTVDLREGQWLAIAGLIQDEQTGSRREIPGLGKIPFVGAAFGSQTTKRGETELVIMVSPELVHPLEQEQVPLHLPGMEVTDPTNFAFFWKQRVEGNPHQEYRSTIWPEQRRQLRGNERDVWRAEKRGVPVCKEHFTSEDYYIAGPNGFSD